jgi:GNAT superfamily N-acetyltransferase
MAATEAAGLPSIVALEAADAVALCPLSEEAGWNQVAQDWRLMLRLGRGFGARGRDGRWIGSALALPLGSRLAWISMVLVTQPARGKGLGTALLSAALAAAEASGHGAGLDATEFGRPIYLPLGFRDVFALARWQLAAPPRTPVAPPPGICVGAAGRQDLAAILAYDPARSGFCRAAILGDLMSRSAGFAQVARTESGALAGFVLGRDGHLSWHIGPVVAEDEATALALLSTAAARLAQPLIVDVPERHGRVRDWLLAQGATAPRRFSRMLRGGAGERSDAVRIFALAGPELG